jgi:signal transduction histidine kinase
MREPNNNFASAVDLARLQFVLRGQPLSLASTYLLAAVTLGVMWSSVSHVVLASWAALFTVVTVLRASLWLLSRSAVFAARPLAFWRALFVLGCGLSGACWGLGGVVLQSSDPLPAMFLAIAIAGTAAGAITSLAADRWSAFALVLSCLVPFAVKEFLLGTPVDMAIGFVTLLFLFTIGGSVNRFHWHLSTMMAARAELQESQAAVSLLNERMKLAANAAEVGIYEWDLVTQAVNWDEQVYKMWDLDAAEGPATLAAWRSRIHPADLARTQERFGVIFKKDKDFDLEFRVVSRSGVVRDIRSRGFMERDAAGKPIKMVGLVMDVTELRRLDRMKQEFVSMVSHELRTPLTAIRGALGLLASNSIQPGDDSATLKSRQLIDLANRNAARLALLIDDILVMDKIESGKMRFELANHDLHDLLSQALVSNKTYADSLGVSFALRPASVPIVVFVDPNRFLQVITNLLSNAAKFSPRGKTVEVATTLQGSVHEGVNRSMVRVSVSDHGPGIPLEFQSKIFGKFCQSDSSDSRSKTGSGLGLAISKAITEAMKGTIGFTTLENSGTTFFLNFLVAANSAASAEQQLRMVAIDLTASLAHSDATAHDDRWSAAS